MQKCGFLENSAGTLRFPLPPPGVPTLDESKSGLTASLPHADGGASDESHVRVLSFPYGSAGFRTRKLQRDRRLANRGREIPSGRLGHPSRWPPDIPHAPAEFEGAAGRQDRDVFARALTEKLLVYAIGRGLERYDRPTVAEIVAKLPAQDYRFSTLVSGIVNSLPFQMRSATQ